MKLQLFRISFVHVPMNISTFLNTDSTIHSSLLSNLVQQLSMNMSTVFNESSSFPIYLEHM
uniref:Uncharacterized protein n=1 Tax=Arundo donax TaxID=35708 RepID=A0A0A8YXY4_ARUDO